MQALRSTHLAGQRLIWDSTGWFPFLFYGPTWVGETYFRYSISPEQAAVPSNDKLGDIGRIGSLSLVIFSIVTLFSSVVLPPLVKSPDRAHEKFTPRPPPILAKFLTNVNELKPDLLDAWLLSHLIFALSMGLTPFVRSLSFATTLMSISGIPWALACWAPFSFIGVEINRLAQPTTILANGAAYRRLPPPTTNLDDDAENPSPPAIPMLRLHHLARDADPDDDEDDDDDVRLPDAHASTGETAGIYLGILNLYTTLPQFIGTFISMLVFAVFEPGLSKELAVDGTPGGAPLGGAGEDSAATTPVAGQADGGGGVNAIAVCLFIGALSSCGAAYATWRLKFVK